MSRHGLSWWGMLCAVLLFVQPAGAQNGPEIVVQSGHTARVNALAADPERSLVATASNDYTVRLWRILPPADGALIRVFAGHTNFVTDVTFNVNDPTQIASCALDKTLRLWDVSTGRAATIFLEDAPRTLAYRTNSNIIAVGFENRSEIVFYDANTGGVTDRPIALSAPATKITFGDRGEVIYCGLSNGMIEAFDARSKERIGSWNVGTEAIVSVFASKGRLAAVSSDGGVLTKRTTSDPVVHQIPAGATSATPTIDQDTVLVTTVDAQLIRVAVTTGRTRTQPTSAKQLDAVVQAADGTTLLYGEVEAQLYAWWIQRPGAATFTVQPTGAVQQSALALAPSGEYLAVGDDHGTLTVYALRQAMTPLRFADLGFRKIAAVSFTADGSQLLVGGFGSTWLVGLDTRTWDRTMTMEGQRSITAVCANSSSHVYLLDERREELLHLVQREGNWTAEVEVSGATHAAISVDRRRMAAVSQNQLTVFDATNGHLRSKAQVSISDPIASVGIDPEGSAVYVGTIQGELIVLEPTSGSVVRSMPGLHAAAIVDMVVEEQSVLTASTDGSIRRWSRSTLRPGDPDRYVEHTGQIRSIDVGAQGTILASAAADGRIIIRNLYTAALSRTIAPVGHEWIVFDGEGHYDASVKGADLVRVVNGLEILPIERFVSDLYRPLILTSRSRNDQAPALVSSVKAAPEPPHVQIHAPAIAGAITDSVITLDVDVMVPKAGGAVKLDVYVNGKYIERRTHRTTQAGETTISLQIPLVADTNQIRIVPADDAGVGLADALTVVRERALTTRPPRTYILAVGINSYRNPTYDLIFARDDATSIVETLKRSIPKNRESEIIELLDERATRGEVLKALERIRAEARPQDAMIFYYAGHGAVLRSPDRPGEYCFALHGVADINNSSVLQREGLLGDTLRTYLLAIKAQRQAVIIDACYSGLMLESFDEVDNARYVSELQRATGATVLASVLPNKRAKEIAELRHGVFTYALLEGLQGAAADRDGEVTILSLLNYIAKTMPSIGQRYGIELQQPVIRFEGAAQTLVLAGG